MRVLGRKFALNELERRDEVKMPTWTFILLASLSWLAVVPVALVQPVARPPRHVVCGGAAADYFTERFGCTAEEAAKAERKLLPKIAEGMTRARAEAVCGWLQSALDLSDSELKKPVLRHPAILTYSIKANLAPTVTWLQSTLDLSDVELKKMLLVNPSMLGQSIETCYAPKLKWLQSRLDLSNSELSKLVLASPQVPTLSIETNLAPKIDWFEQELGLSVSDARAKILASPARLTLSLTKRYQPRLKVCRAAGADPMIVLNSASKKDEVFCKRVGVPLETLRAAQEKSPELIDRLSSAPAAASTPSVVAAPAAYKMPSLLLTRGKIPTELLSSWTKAGLRPWQLEVNEMIQEPTNNTGIWLFDSQTYPGRGKGTFFKHLIATTGDVYYMTQSSRATTEETQVYIDDIKSVSKQSRAVCYRLARADSHGAALYEVLEAVAPKTHVVVACSFWPDLGLLPNRSWRLFEWDDHNNIHELPPGAYPEGRVGLGDTNSGEDYMPYWNRNCEGDKARE